jgi:cold shock CspA family protein
MPDIPAFLLNQIQEGGAVLFLGAGASAQATTAEGKKSPTSSELRNMLADKFLGGEYKGSPLNQVAEYAISESDLNTVQTYIKQIFEPLEPTDAHRKICRLSWYGLATTNYDVLIEKAYSQPSALQQVRPLIENGDRIEDNLRDPKNILLLKLHGCITRTANPACPLILTTDQYVEHRRGRERVFETLKTWAYEYPLLFVGHSLQDPDIRGILLELAALGESRPRYYFVAPDVDQIRARFWEAKKISAIRASFDEFMTAVDGALPHTFRSLWVAKREVLHPIETKFKVSSASLSKAARQFLDVDVDYVRSIATTEHVEPKDFYRGFNKGFAPIEQALDVRRKLGDSLLSDYFLRDVEQLEDRPEVLLVKGHAGAGKTILLRRVAWDAAREYDRICLFLKAEGLISVAALQEVIGLCKQRVFLFIDNAASRMRDLQSLIKNIGPEGKLLTVVLGARLNEWNIQSQDLGLEVTDEYEVKYLYSSEIEPLLKLLEKNGALGTLAPLTPEKRIEALEEKAGRQLLVALHEATLGRPFEEILVDEFKHIQPFEAQRIYVTICVLNRLQIPVRAGIIARIHGIRFDEFKKRFFLPLEHVVFVEKDDTIRDYVYRARHPHIADVVFLQVLYKPEERFDAYLRCVKALNLAYSVDWSAFWQMVRGRTLLELFPDQSMVDGIFKAAWELVGEDAHLLHQMANYEMRRPNGSIKEAERLLNRAHELAPWDMTITHTVAELKLRAVDSSKTELERSKLLGEAANLSLGLISGEKNDSYAFHTLVKVNLRKLKETIDHQASDLDIERCVKEVEYSLFDGLQRFPGDAYLRETESQLAALLKDDKRVLNALQKAFEANSRSSFIALRLASIYEALDRVDNAHEVLQKAIGANNSDQRLHYAYAKLLMRMPSIQSDELIYHLRRSFTDGDQNYDARILYARQLFVDSAFDESRKVFDSLRKLRLAPGVRNQLLYSIDGISEGRISKLETTYCFISRDGAGDWIYAYCSNVDENTWKNLTYGVRVRFEIAFSVRGPGAFNVELSGSESVVSAPQLGLFSGDVK